MAFPDADSLHARARARSTPAHPTSCPRPRGGLTLPALGAYGSASTHLVALRGAPRAQPPWRRRFVRAL
eukprot:scaffold63790_cov70-Phaeocystis_antarctica.AAC.3